MPQGKIFIDTTGRLTATIRKDDGTLLAGSTVTALTLTIRNRDANNTVVNSRNDAALTPISTYLNESGALTVDLLPADNALIDSIKDHEIHRVIIKWTYTGGAKGALSEDYEVRNPAVVA